MTAAGALADCGSEGARPRLGGSVLLDPPFRALACLLNVQLHADVIGNNHTAMTVQQLLCLLPRRAAADGWHCRRWLASAAGNLAAIRELRELSGAPITDVKAALQQSAWDLGAGTCPGRFTLCFTVLASCSQVSKRVLLSSKPAIKGFPACGR